MIQALVAPDDKRVRGCNPRIVNQNQFGDHVPFVLRRVTCEIQSLPDGRFFHIVNFDSTVIAAVACQSGASLSSRAEYKFLVEIQGGQNVMRD